MGPFLMRKRNIEGARQIGGKNSHFPLPFHSAESDTPLGCKLHRGAAEGRIFAIIARKASSTPLFEVGAQAWTYPSFFTHQKIPLPYFCFHEMFLIEFLRLPASPKIVTRMVVIFCSEFRKFNGKLSKNLNLPMAGVASWTEAACPY